MIQQLYSILVDRLYLLVHLGKLEHQELHRFHSRIKLLQRLARITMVPLVHLLLVVDNRFQQLRDQQLTIKVSYKYSNRRLSLLLY